MEKVTVSADALRQVLQALNGPRYRIAELQALRHGHFSGDNPINRLTDEYNAALQRPANAEPVRLTDKEINAVHEDCETSYVPGSLVAFETFFAWGVETALLHKLGINDRPAGG